MEDGEGGLDVLRARPPPFCIWQKPGDSGSRRRRVKSKFLSKTIQIALILTLGGCIGWDVPAPKPTTGRNPTVAEVPDQSETVRGEDDPPIVTLELGAALHERRLTESDDLPGNIIVPTTNLSAVPVTAALQGILAGTDVSIAWDTGALGDRLVTVINLSGPLPKVVERVCAAAKVFCTYRDGTIELAEKDTFVVAMPPIPKTINNASNGNSYGGSSSSGSTTSGSATTSNSSSGSNVNGGSNTNSMVDTISQLVGTKVQLDDQGGNVIYTTDVEGEKRVNRYLEELRNGRPLVVMQMYIWEVDLSKENAAGINWSQLDISKFGPPLAKIGLSSVSNFTDTSQTAGNVSLGAVTTGKIKSSSLLNFLSTQGRVQTISSPQMTFVSGSAAELKVGGVQTYISQVGQLVGTTNTSGTANANTGLGVGNNTVSTSTINTGLTVDVAGTYENGVVFANLDLDLTDVTNLNPTTNNGVTIDLPVTTDEKIDTVIRVRPGDNLLMAGLVTSRDTNTRQGLPLDSEDSLNMYGDNQRDNHELVLLIKPSVILFSDHGSPTTPKKPAKPMPDAVVIDGGGTQSVAIPTSDNAPSPGAPTPLSAPAPDNNAVVDQQLMQRGFSHAFDQLLDSQPTGEVAGNGSPTP